MRITVENEHLVLDVEKKVLDKGHIRLVDYCGSDNRIVQAARVSYGEGTKTIREDKGLIDYLLRNEHMSPFEMVNFTFHMKAPIFVMRQLVRHRTAKLNEISGRYSVMKDECYVPEFNRIAKQSTDNKQGSGDLLQPSIAGEIRGSLQTVQELVFSKYNEYIDFNLAKEIARINLPLSTYTEWYWNIDLRNLLNFLKLRMDSHAQYEIRVYADTLYDIVKVICPFTIESFDNHIRFGVSLSKQEKEALYEVIKDKINYENFKNILTEKQFNELVNKFK